MLCYRSLPCYFLAASLFFYFATFLSSSRGDSQFPPLQTLPTSGTPLGSVSVWLLRKCGIREQLPAPLHYFAQLFFCLFLQSTGKKAKIFSYFYRIDAFCLSAWKVTVPFLPNLPLFPGWENEGKYGVEHLLGTRRSLVEGPIGAPVESTSFILASKRTQRKDPLNGFKTYTGGWNISERHYWAVSLSNPSHELRRFLVHFPGGFHFTF